MASSDPTLAFTLPVQLTRTIHREPYSYILPKNNPQTGKIILVTGGGSGIGAAAASVWVHAGAEGVVIAGRREAKLKETAAALELASKGTKILAVQTDVTIPDQVEHLCSEVKRVFGRTADVVLVSAGWVSGLAKVGEDPVDNWWKIHEINVKGLYTTIHYFIRSQNQPETPVGTIISVSSAMSGGIAPGVSAYSTSKYVGERLIEYVDSEYPTLRAFSILPGVVLTDLIGEQFKPFAKDNPELTGMVALWLAQSKSDFLRGQLVSVNWDLKEVEQHAQKIKEEGLLKSRWIPILPVGGGKGLP